MITRCCRSCPGGLVRRLEASGGGRMIKIKVRFVSPRMKLSRNSRRAETSMRSPLSSAAECGGRLSRSPEPTKIMVWKEHPGFLDSVMTEKIINSMIHAQPRVVVVLASHLLLPAAAVVVGPPSPDLLSAAINGLVGMPPAGR